MRRNNLHRRSYKPLLKKSVLPDIRLYDLRHTFATLMFENSEQLKLVSAMLGHASVKQTADTYTHVSPTMHREAAMRPSLSVIRWFLRHPRIVFLPRCWKESNNEEGRRWWTAP